MSNANTLTCGRQERGDVTIVALTGALNAETSPALRSESESLAAAGHKKIVLDLQALELIDSSGVAAIVMLRKRVQERQGDVKIAGIQLQPAEIFKLLRLDRVFELCPSVDRAVADFAS